MRGDPALTFDRGSPSTISHPWRGSARWLLYAVVGAWTAYWLYVLITEWGSHGEHGFSLSRTWLAAVLPFPLAGLEGAWLVLLALLPPLLLLAGPRLRLGGWIRPEGWRPGWLLAGWVASLVVPGILTLGMPASGAGCDGVARVVFGPCGGAGQTAYVALRLLVLCLGLVVLCRRMGPLRGWDAGGLAAVVVGAMCAFAVAAEGALRMIHGFAWPVLHAVHWTLVIALAALIERWLALRPLPPRRLSRIVAAAGGSFGAVALVASDALSMTLVVAYVLALATLLHALWRHFTPAAGVGHA